MKFMTTGITFLRFIKKNPKIKQYKKGSSDTS